MRTVQVGKTQLLRTCRLSFPPSIENSGRRPISVIVCERNRCISLSQPHQLSPTSPQTIIPNHTSSTSIYFLDISISRPLPAFVSLSFPRYRTTSLLKPPLLPSTLSFTPNPQIHPLHHPLHPLQPPNLPRQHFKFPFPAGIHPQTLKG